MQGTIFTNANATNPFLFISTEKAEGWCAFLMNESENFSNPEISFKTIWDGSGSRNLTKFSGEFLFARKQPQDLSDGYLAKLRAVLKSKIKTLYSKSLVWLLDPDATPSGQNVVVVPLFEKSADNFEIVKAAKITWGGIGELSFVKNASAQKEISGDYSAIRFPMPATVPNLRPIKFALALDGGQFDKNRHAKQVPPEGFVSIPLSGDGRGCIRFEMELLEDEDLMSFDLGQKFFYSKDGNGQMAQFDFPFLREVRPNRAVRMQVSIDPANLQNLSMTPGQLDPARTYLAFKGTTRNNLLANTLEPTVFESWFRTHNGYRIKLRPNTAGAASEAKASTLFADRKTARLVWCEKKKDSNDWYFAPAGEFFIVLNEADVEKAVVNGQAHLLAGLSGTETIGFQPTTQAGEGDRLRFQPYRPAFAPKFPLTGNAADSGANGPLLTDASQTSWANVVASNGKKVSFASEPEGASLYSKEHGINAIAANGSNGLLGFFELAVEMPQDVDFAIPLVPYEGVQLATDTPVPEGLDAFEAQVISTSRKAIISTKLPPAIFGKNEPEVIISTTPQGAIAKVKPDGRWNEVILAQNSIGATGSNYLNFKGSGAGTFSPEFKVGFINLSEALKDAFQTNQQFLVATQAENLGRLFTKMTDKQQKAGESGETIFNNKMFIRDWPFFIHTGSNGDGGYRNVLIFKFCKGSLKERLKDPAIWTRPGHFNPPGELPQVAKWLQDYIAQAEAQSSPYFSHFKNIVNSENWNGILALKLDLAAETFPENLKGMLGGIDTSRLNIHHFGIEINHVETAGEIKIGENSSLFGLISYFDEKYQQGLLAGANPDLPVTPAAGTFDFKVLSLQVLFENTEIKDFACKVQVTMNELLQDNVRHVSIQDVVAESKTNSLILNGTYEEHEGEMAYIFKQTKSNKFHLDSNILHFMEIERAYFDTVSTENNFIQSRFRFGGNINFEILEGEDGPLDLFSFGSERDMEGFDIGKGLRFSNLYLDMAFDLATPETRTFDMIVQDFKLNIENSYSRTDGFFSKFPLNFQGFIFGTGDRLPTQFGYEPVKTPAIKTEKFTGEWLGLKYKVNCGSSGMLASSGAFDAEFLLAWSPQGKEDDEKYRLYFGILLPGAAGNSKALTLQGILKLGVDTISIDFGKKSEDAPGAYVLSLNNIGLRFFNFPMLPPPLPSIPGVTVDKPEASIFLFANGKQVVKKNIGWLMAFKMPPELNIKGVSIPFVALGQHVAFKSTAGIESVSDAMGKMKSAFFPSNGGELMVKFVYGSLDEEEEKGLELVFSDDSDWLIAFEFGLMGKIPNKVEANDSETGKKDKAKFDNYAIDVAVIFNDPEIYGLRLALGGEAMKVFKGLEFEILYKKVTDSIGVYKILFTLPDKFRRFEVGAAKLTLPVLGLDIYTNGDFKVDLGFPYGLDFSRSFSIEVQAGPFPLVGSAGFYFGKLSGETALMLPPIVKDGDGKPVGRFDTVIIFGFGFEIGFGKSIEKGVMSASFKITLVAVVEGVVAPFIPNNEVTTSGNIEETNYYWVQGTIGLVGILTGKVDFGVISASVYVRVYALIQATFESYRPVPIILKAGVEVRVSIKIAFVRIKFSFSATIEAKIVVGTDRWLQAPWNQVPTSGLEMAMAMRGVSDAISVIGYGAYTFTGPKTPLSLLFSLQPTVNDAKQASYVAMLLMDSQEFKQLSDDVFRWVVSSFKGIQNPDALTLGDLEDIRDCLKDEGPGQAEIEAFLQRYFEVSIVSLEEEKDMEATIFPMFPALQIDWTGSVAPINFASHNVVTAEYLAKMKEFLQDLDLVGEETAAAHGAGSSLATIIFEDYFLMIAKHTVDEAIQSFKNFSYELTDGHTLGSIAADLGNQVAIGDIAAQNKFHPLTAGSNFHELSISEGKDFATLAAERKDTADLFDKSTDRFLGITTLSSLSTGDLVDDLARNNVSTNLAGMVARYQLNGLRLPELGVTEVNTNTRHLSLFHLTGQEFALPDNLTTGNFDLVLTRPDSQAWLKVGEEKSLTISQEVTELNKLRSDLMAGFALASFDFSLTPVAAVEQVEQRFNFNRFSVWANTGQPANSLIWHFPDTLLHHLFANPGAGGNLSVKYGVFNEAKQRLEYFPETAEWGTLVDVTIKRKPGQDENTLRYELIGTDEIGITLLERLLLSGEEIIGGNIQLLYDASGNNDKKSLQSVDIGGINTFITQANLSTETNPVASEFEAMRSRGVASPHGILNAPEDFIRLIWECSIVRSGGYYLFYQNMTENTGLPKDIFDDDETAVLSILIKSDSGVPANFTNFARTGTAIDAANSMVFAEDPKLTHPVALLPQSVVAWEVSRTTPDEPEKIVDPVTGLAGYYEDFLENLYQLLAFQVAGSDHFDGSRMSIPLGPAKDVGDIDADSRKRLPGAPDGTWRYKMAVPLARFAKPTAGAPKIGDEPNPYEGIGQTPSLTVSWRDLYGNQALSNNLEQTIGELGYTDQLLSIARWPNVTANYEFDQVDADNFKLNIHLGYTKPNFEINEQVSEEQQAAAFLGRIAESKQIFAKIFYQLNQPDVSLSLVSSFFENGGKVLDASDLQVLNSFIESIYNYLNTLKSDLGQATPGASVLVIEFAKNDINSAGIFELEVGLKIQRVEALVDAAFKTAPEVASATGYVQPIFGTASQQLVVFAEDFEKVFAGENLKIATGINKEDLNTNRRQQDVWVVRMNELKSDIGDKPLYLALKPLSTKLDSGLVDVYKYAPNTGLDLTQTDKQSFAEIDRDTWAQQFLEAVDDFLTPELATSAFLVDKKLNTDHLKMIVEDKRTLADRIVSGLTRVWKLDRGEKPPTGAQMNEAREKLKQQLLIKLRQAYLVNTVVQFGVDTGAGFPEGSKNPVRLYGKPVIVSGDGTGSGDRNFSFSTAKISLNTQPDTEPKINSFLTFLFDTHHDEAKATVDFDLNYKITHLEHRIEDSAQMEGYEISSWLMFVKPVDASDSNSPLVKSLGHLKIPVVLRNFPTPPTLERQFGEQSQIEPGKSALANATQWDYGFTYTQRAAAQDTIKAGVTLNLVPASMAMSRSVMGGRSFFEELATFITLYPPVQADLAATLPGINANTPATDANLLKAGRAMDAFRQLVDRVAMTWPIENTSAMAMASRGLDNMKTNVRFDFEIQEMSRDGSDTGDFLTEVTPRKVSHFGVTFDTPVIRVEGFSAQLDVAKPDGQQIYNYGSLDWKGAKGIAGRTAVLENLNILEWQNAISEVTITRNEDLLDGKKTSQEFIYTTSVVKFPNKIVPLLDNEQPVNIAEIETGKSVNRKLAEQLRIFFKTLLDRGLAVDDQLIKLECLYAFQLKAGGGLPDVKLPVLLVPPYAFQLPTDWDLGNENSFVNQLAKGITTWFNEHLPSDDNLQERFLFDVSIFSKLEASKLPVVRLRNVFLEVDAVSDLKA